MVAERLNKALDDLDRTVERLEGITADIVLDIERILNKAKEEILEILR